jgi:integrase
MQWREVGVLKPTDAIADMWVCLPEHMKSGREFGVPLSPEAMAVLERVRQTMPFRAGDDLVFPGVGGVEQGRNTAMRFMTGRLGVVGPTIHGFRSSFKTWATQLGNGTPRYPRMLSELALDHVIADPVELAYLRKPEGHREDYRAERRPMMEAWAAFCFTPSAAGEVIAPAQFSRGRA